MSVYIEIATGRARHIRPGQVFQDVVWIDNNRYLLMVPKEDVAKTIRRCRACKFKVLYVYDGGHERSSGYRKAFIRAHPPDKNGNYRCRYCHRKISIKEMQVDHIYPVKKAKEHPHPRYFKTHGITDVNDVKNLCPSCRRCNRRKGANTGLWLARARWGTHPGYWVFLKIMKLTLIILCVLAAIWLYQIGDGNWI